MKPESTDQATILLVDDTPSTIRMVSAALEAAGYRVLVATSGEKALERVSLLIPDLILLDILLPGMDGYETCRRLKSDSRFVEIPVIFMSALAETFDKVKGFELGAVDYVVKPIQIEELLSRAQTHITIHRLQKRQQEANATLEERVRERTKELQQSNEQLRSEIAERTSAQKKNEQLANLLSAIRIINQLIVREKRRDILLKAICDSLREARGYQRAWIAHFDGEHRLITCAEAGMGEEAFETILGRLEQDMSSLCCGRALLEPGVLVIDNPARACAHCPMAEELGNSSVLAVRLEHGGKVYGILVAALTEPIDRDEEELTLIRELAGDIGLALHSIEEEERRKRVEESLRQSEYKLRLIVENTTSVVFAYGMDRRLMYVNPAVEDFIGYSTEEIAREGFGIWLHPEDQERMGRTFEGLFDGRSYSNKELRLVTKEGQIKWSLSSWGPMYDENGFQIGVQGRERDITDRKMVEDELKASEEKFRQIAENIEEVFWLKTDDQILYVSPAYEKICGRSCTSLYQDPRSAIDSIHPQDRHRVIDAYRSAVQTSDFDEEFRIIRPDGEIRWIWGRMFPIKQDGERISRRTGIAEDITERKHAEEEKEKLGAQLRQLQKMEALGTLAGGIAHDFNNVLVPIIGYTQMVMDELDESSHARTNLGNVLSAANRAADLIRQILTFARETEQPQQPLRLQPITKEALKLLSATLPATIEVAQYIDSRCGLVEGDPTQVHQILVNLCTNAYQALRQSGGRLEVRLDEVELDSEDEHAFSGLHKGTYVRLTVADTGTGMEKEVMERIFEPYFTTRQQEGGSGIGLAVVHGIVKQMKGDIKVYSELGKGTTFQVYLPRISTKLLEGQPPARSEILRGSERILLVDDEEMIVDMLQQLLMNLGYQVSPFQSSVDALMAFEREPHSYDLIITDMTMPNITGIALARSILSIRPDVPVILCTGYNESVTEQSVKEAGIRELIIKPIIRGTLAGAIRRALDL